jgi:Mrp family chromosome partitioning ATPase
MSRVYNVLTGAARSAESGTGGEPADAAWDSAESTPFVEIGGPAGPIFSPVLSPGAPAPSSSRTTPPEPEPKPDATRTYPRLAPQSVAPAYLSVRFHDAIAQATRPAADGPDASLVALHFPDHTVSAEYRSLRDEICKQLPLASSRVLHFAAAANEAGTTTVLLNFAITLAQHKNRVLVVDANISRPAAASKLALKATPGLCEVLGGHIPLAWALQPSPLPTLQVLAAGEGTDETNATIARDLPRLFGQLRQWFDWVLVDAGVWGSMPERDSACSSADAVYLVTRDTDAERPEFMSVRGGVKELGGLLRGYVATRV